MNTKEKHYLNNSRIVYTSTTNDDDVVKENQKSQGLYVKLVMS